MSKSEQPFLIEGLYHPTDTENHLDYLPIDTIKQIMANYSHSDNWKNHALPKLKEIAERNDVQFNLNINIGRLVLCDYPNKLVISSPLDPNNQSSEVSVVKGTFARSKGYVLQELKCSIENARAKGINKILGVYGQLSFDSNKQSQQVGLMVKIVLDFVEDKIDAVATSGSLLGVGGIGHKIAKDKGLKTIGIIPQTVAFRTDPKKFDLLLIQGEDWGDGSYLFGGLADSILFMGGGYWSFLEYKYAKLFDRKVKLYKGESLRYSKEFLNDGQAGGDFEQNLNVIIEHLSRQT